jgi:hypothetical protein
MSVDDRSVFRRQQLCRGRDNRQRHTSEDERGAPRVNNQRCHAPIVARAIRFRAEMEEAIGQLASQVATLAKRRKN